MKLNIQNILYPSTDTCSEEELYFRRSSDKIFFSWTNSNKIEIEKDGFVSFDTYFNGLSIEKWTKYTNAQKISLTLHIKGTVRLTLMRKEKHFDEILTEYIGEYVCHTESRKLEKFTFDFNSVSVSGMYCFAVYGLQEKSVICDGYYSAEVDENQIRPVKIAIDICTFKRERFIRKNIENLNSAFMNNPESYMYDKLEVFISDNAGTLNINELQSDKVHIVKNKNVGGAGGFTRGMIEISRVKQIRKITHILVTDDDIVYEPESIFRTLIFLSCVKEQYIDIFVGGAMLRLDKQYIQVESGAVWNSGFLVSRKNGLDLREINNCLFNETEETTQFNAWWFCAFPVDIVQNDNLPIPIFIRGDDVEYGLRNMKHLALMNGICVWHEPFENKYSSFLSYYVFRNRLIDNSLHNMNMPDKILKKELYGYVMNEIRLYRYKNADLLIQGVEDFLKGIDWLLKQDGEKLHKEIMNSGYKLEYIEELDEDIQFNISDYEASRHVVTPGGLSGYIHRIVAHFTWNGTKLSSKRYSVTVPVEGLQQISLYRVEKALNYDYVSKKAFVTVKNLKEAKRCVKRLKQVYKLIDKKYSSVSREFFERRKEMQTIQFWLNYLDLEDNKA